MRTKGILGGPVLNANGSVPVIYDFTLNNTAQHTVGVLQATTHEPGYIEYAAQVQNVTTAEGAGGGTLQTAGAVWSAPVRVTTNTDIKATAAVAGGRLLVRVWQGCIPAQSKP